jgi:SAM-dependent methyltransferase
MSPAQTAAAEFFGALAPEYDARWTDSLVGRLQREQVWRVVGRLFHAGERVLDLGCGTGADAQRLARAGMMVHAIDAAPEMVAAAARRLVAERTAGSASVELCALEDLARLLPHAPFDGALSNFAALNCVEDLGAFASDLAALVRPGGRVALTVFGRSCAWELIRYRGRARSRRRLALRVFYPSVRTLSAALRPWFRRVQVRGIGVFVPPSYAESWAGRHPRLLHMLDRADGLAGRAPGTRALADHLLVVFERT